MNEALLKQLVDNRELLEEVQSFFLSLKGQQLSRLDSGKYTNENLGQLVRGIDEGEKWIKEAFVELQRVGKKQQTPPVTSPMPGR